MGSGINKFDSGEITLKSYGYQKTTIRQAAVPGVQKDQLLRSQIQEGRGEKVGNEKVLPLVPQTHRSQRRQKVK